MKLSDIRNDFPVMRKGRYVYLDSACQSLRPDCVIRAMTEYYEDYPACGGRSVHSMSTRVSMGTDDAREKLASFFGTDDPDCYIFTKNCTDGINTVANGFRFGKGDVVVTTDTEHNSNHLPWLLLAERTGVGRRMTTSDTYGEFDIESFKNVMGRDVKLVSVQHASSVTGCVTPVKEIAEIAHDFGAKVMIDAAQSVPHFRLDLEDLDVDFLSFSVHKTMGPSGMGVLYGRRESLEELRPFVAGGGTVGVSTYTRATMAPIPDRFEAGLNNYSGIIGTKVALDYIDSIGFDLIGSHDRELMRMIFRETEDIKGLSIVGPEDPDRRCGAFTFNLGGLLSHDVAMMLDNMDGILIRSGMHCTHPFYESRGIAGGARASTYVYNDTGDIFRFASALRKISETFCTH